MDEWLVYRGTGEPHDGVDRLPPPPPWREFQGNPPNADRWPRDGDQGPVTERAGRYVVSRTTVEMVNTALYLRRPLLVTGPPGTGKTTLAYAIAYELALGRVLRWPVTSRSTLREALYRYDAVGRLENAQLQESRDIGRFLQLGPLGTALLPTWLPRVLLIDEIDKSDVDLPNDLLEIFEEGRFDIPELVRSEQGTATEVFTYDADSMATVEHGRVACRAFPIVVMTSNGERDFPPAFLRRCIQVMLPPPDHATLSAIVAAHLGPALTESSAELIDAFLERREYGELATDQLLNAVYLAGSLPANNIDREELAARVMQRLGELER